MMTKRAPMNHSFGKDYYHTAAEIERSGIEPFLQHGAQYLDNTRSVPVARALDSLRPGRSVYFTFTDSCLEQIHRGDQRLRKAYEVAVKFGYRGISRGGRNGIFLQRRQDTGLRKRTLGLALAQWPQMAPDLLLTSEYRSDLEFDLVKIVQHDPTGRRVVGIKHGDRIEFVGVAEY